MRGVRPGLTAKAGGKKKGHPASVRQGARLFSRGSGLLVRFG